MLALITFGPVPGSDPERIQESPCQALCCSISSQDIPLTTVPEPATIGLLSLGLLGVGPSRPKPAPAAIAELDN